MFSYACIAHFTKKNKKTNKKQKKTHIDTPCSSPAYIKSLVIFISDISNKNNTQNIKFNDFRYLSYFNVDLQNVYLMMKMVIV